jgi:hypothetical protein
VIVNLLLEGCNNAEIAGHLRIAQRTVKAYFNRLFLRFGITSGIKRVKLATFIYRSRLCSDMTFTGSDPELSVFNHLRGWASLLSSCKDEHILADEERNDGFRRKSGSVLNTVLLLTLTAT